MNPRLAALQTLLKVRQGLSLSQALPNVLNQIQDKRDRGFAQTLIFGVLRHFDYLQALSATLIDKPLKNKDQDIQILILLALYQLTELNTAEHAAVSETVNLTQKLKKPWARGLINGVLRQFLRDPNAYQQKVPQDPATLTSHPRWLVEQLQAAYPDCFEAVLHANNQPADLTLRVNKRSIGRDALLQKLENHGVKASPLPLSPVAIRLEQSVDVTQLPLYAEGGFSVQDLAAQQAAIILNPQPGMRVLDACAAPGGKTGHLLEHADNQLDLIALEKEADRLPRLIENLKRLKLDADIRQADAADLASWWDQQAFDQILLDAPCSATGIIRRHPDIKQLRRADDICALTEIQALLLDRLWTCLKPGGKLLYATCSVLPQENRLQIQSFLARTADAQLIALHPDNDMGYQILPGTEGMDGFYYALLSKSNL